MPSLRKPTVPEQLEFDFGPSPEPRARHEPVMTLREAAAVFNVGLHVLRRAINAGSIPSYRVGNARIRVRASDIEHAIEASRTAGRK